jgi:four helix bundle protein
MAHNHNKLEIWIKSVDLTIQVIKALKNVEPHIWPLREQIIRSAVSIPSNIAEGSERNTKKDFIRFLYISKASNAELRSQLTILAGVDMKYIEFTQQAIPELIEIAEMTQGFINRLEKQSHQ